MKFIPVVVIILLLTGFTATVSYAVKPALSVKEQLQNVIREKIVYPETEARNCCTGVVDVTFRVDENGKIIVEKTIADNVRLDKAVRMQLSEMTVKDIQVPAYTHYRISIAFRLIE